MAKALKTVAIVAGVAALAFTGVGLAAGLGVAATSFGIGVSASTLFLVAGGAGVAAQLLTKAPKVPQAQTDRLTANIDPRAFRKTPLGQTALPIDVRYEEWSGTDQEYCDWIVCHASCAIDGVEEIWLNTELAWSQTTGVTAKFSGYFWVPNIVLEGNPGNAFTFGSGRWNGSTRLTGCAYSRLRFKVTGNGKKGTSPFSSGIPSRITIIGRGARLYDPRRDSTVPGGAGPMRADDQSTWRYTADDGAVIGENLALHTLRMVLGWRIRNPVTGQMLLATGSGVPGRRLQLASWIESANLADELVNRAAGGQEPRYHGAGVVSEGEDTGASLDAWCAACNGRFRDTNGRLSFTIAHNDLASAATDDGLNDDDVIGSFSWDPDPALDGTPNVVRGQYVDATTGSLYQLVDYPEVRLPSPDGQDRILVLNLGVCESASMAQRIAKQALQRAQYKREFTAPFDIRAWKYPVGALLPLTYAPLSFARALFRVKAQDHTDDGTCVMTLTVEHPAMYQWDADDRLPVLAAEPIAYDASRNPLVLALADLESQVTQILSDNVITREREKRDLVRQWDGMTAQFEALDDRFDDLGNPASMQPGRTDASTKLGALGTYLNGLAPAWNNVDVDTPVDGAFLDARWRAARAAVEVFAAAITGMQGPPGINNATVTIYQRSASGAPALPSAVATYTFATASLSGLSNGWSMSIPVGSDPIYASAATASSTGATDTIAANEWATARQIASNGANGTSGLNNKSLFIYQRSASAPALPSQNATYTFSTAITAGLNNGWTATIPAANGLPLWVSTATALSPTDVDNINPGEWATAQKLAEDGDDGISPPLITVAASSQQVRYNKADQMVSGDITVLTLRQNSTETPRFTIVSADGATHGTANATAAELKAQFGAQTFDTTGPDNLILKASWLNAVIQNNGGSIRITAAISGGSGVVSMSKTKDGADGSDGANGLPGVKGADGTTWYNYVAYANSPDGQTDFTTGAPGTRTYVGFGTGTSATEPESPLFYSWSPYRGPPFGMASRGGVVVAGDQLIKASGNNAWDADAYSTVGFRSGATVSFRAGQTNAGVMAGLNSDPLSNASFDSLDYALYPGPDGNASIFSNGSSIKALGSYTTATLFQVVYDNLNAIFLMDGSEKHRIVHGPDALFYFDSSLADVGGRLVDIQFTARGSDGKQGANGASNTSAAAFGSAPVGTLIPPGATVTIATSVLVRNQFSTFGNFTAELYRQTPGGGSVVVQSQTFGLGPEGEHQFDLSGQYTNNTGANVFLQATAAAFRTDGTNVGGAGYVRIS